MDKIMKLVVVSTVSYRLASYLITLAVNLNVTSYLAYVKLCVYVCINEYVSMCVSQWRGLPVAAAT